MRGGEEGETGGDVGSQTEETDEGGERCGWVTDRGAGTVTGRQRGERGREELPGCGGSEIQHMWEGTWGRLGEGSWGGRPGLGETRILRDTGIQGRYRVVLERPEGGPKTGRRHRLGGGREHTVVRKQKTGADRETRPETG